MSVAISVDGITKRYRIGQYQGAYGTLRDSIAAGTRRVARREHRPHYEEIWALRDVSFRLGRGGVLGVIGRNGAGKSTLLKILTRITTPTTGTATIRGRVGSLLEVGTGFHPELTGRQNVYLNGSVLGMKHREITKKFSDIVEFSGVEQFIDTPVKRYSSGMSVRLAFAVAAHLEPEVLLVDEVLAVGDAEFQRRCLGRMEDMSASGRTVLFVSHQMQSVAQLCERVIWLDKGSVVDDGPSSQVVARYLQSGYGGSSSSREWPDLATAPGDDLVRLRSVRVVQDDQEAMAVDVRLPVGIEIAFTILGDGEPVFPKIKLVDQRGDVVFNAMDTNRRWHEPASPGEYTSTAWVPANLLNEGLLSVQVAICSYGTLKLRNHAGLNDAVSFHVQDPAEGTPREGSSLGNGGASSDPCSTGRPRAVDVQVVGIVLVHNEDVFVERAIRNVAHVCDRIHAIDHRSRDGTWDVLRTLAREYDHLDARRISHARVSHEVLEPYVGSDVWVLQVDGDELHDPAALVRLREAIDAGEFRRAFRVQANVLHCDRLDPEGWTASGYMSPPSRPLARLFNLGCRGGLVGMRTAPAGRGSPVSAGVRMGLGRGPPGALRLGGEPIPLPATRASSGAPASTRSIRASRVAA